MNKLQRKYNALHIAYWCSTFSILGCVAIILQYKGLSNTEIGLVTGASSICTIFLSPMISAKVQSIQRFSIQQILIGMLGYGAIGLAILLYLPLPKWVVMFLYLSLYASNISTVPLISTIAIQYIEQGSSVNFGLSRGLGSISYAFSAVVVGNLIARLGAPIVGITYLASTLYCFFILASLPRCTANDAVDPSSQSSLAGIFRYKTFLIILTGFGLMYVSTACLGTYLINIVSHLGGDASLFGVATFFSAASELPFMAITPRLKRRFGTKNLLIVAAICYVIRNGIICIAANLPILFLGMCFQGMSYGIFTPIITYYVADHLAKEDQIMGQTLIGVMTSGFGAAIGNLCGGYIQDTFGLDRMFLFVLGTVLIGSAIGIWINLKKEDKNEESALDPLFDLDV